MPDIKNRITRHGEACPKDLVSNPKNWRKHSDIQEDALAGVLDDVGWVQSVIVNERSGRLVDGHLRVKLAEKRGEKTIPVVYVDLSEAEEAEVLATLDPLGAMAEADAEKLDALLDEIQTDSDSVIELMDGLSSPLLPLTYGDEMLNHRTQENNRMGSKGLSVELVCIGRWAGRVDAELVQKAVEILDARGDPDEIATALCDGILING